MTPVQPILLLLVFLAASRLSLAQRLSVPGITSYVFSDLTARTDDLPAGCTTRGVCVPEDVVVPALTTYVWCGWTNTRRTFYRLNSTATFSFGLMLRRELEDCMIKNIANVSNCVYMARTSICNRVTRCENRQLGWAMPREMCAVVSNTQRTRSVIRMQIYTATDVPRDLGTVFSLLIAILWAVYTVANLTCGITYHIQTPLHKHVQPKQPRVVCAPPTPASPSDGYRAP